MYRNDRLLILDADGTTIDAFAAIERTFRMHGMDIGDLERFQKRRHMFKYLGGLKEFPSNLKRQIGKQKRTKLIKTLTEIYREEAKLYRGIAPWLNLLGDRPGLRVGVITRNITNDPIGTLGALLKRHDVDVAGLDFLVHIPLKHDKTAAFRDVRDEYAVNPARCYACGDEKQDFLAAVSTGMHPFMVSYGFEDFARLTEKVGVPAELISQSSAEFRERVSHGLGIDDADRPQSAALAPRTATPEPEAVLA